MTIDEAIAHALEVAGELQERADSAELIDILDGLDVEACKECATDHRQLAEWLTELKQWHENPFKMIKNICTEHECSDCLISNSCQHTDGRWAEYPSEWEVE